MITLDIDPRILPPPPEIAEDLRALADLSNARPGDPLGICFEAWQTGAKRICLEQPNILFTGNDPQHFTLMSPRELGRTLQTAPTDGLWHAQSLLCATLECRFKVLREMLEDGNHGRLAIDWPASASIHNPHMEWRQVILLKHAILITDSLRKRSDEIPNVRKAMRRSAMILFPQESNHARLALSGEVDLIGRIYARLATTDLYLRRNVRFAPLTWPD